MHILICQLFLSQLTTFIFHNLKKKKKNENFLFFLNCSQITFTHALCYEEAAKSDNTLPAWIKAFSGFFKK